MIKKIAAVVYKIEKGEPLFFVGKRPEADGIWQYVTGTGETNENFQQTLFRELEEELGVTNPLNVIDLNSFNDFHSGSGKKYHEKAYAIEIDEVKKLQKEEFKTYKWLDEKAASALVRWPSHKSNIQKTAKILKEGRYPKIIIICAPGGAGKDTLIKSILSKFDLVRPKTYTTRALRKDGKEWRKRLSVNQFEEMDKSGKFIESNFFGGYWYATPRHEIENAIKKGKSVILEIDLNGLESFKKIYSNVVSFFIYTDLETLEKRLRERNCHDEQYIKTRMKIAEREIANSSKCDFIISNEEGKLNQAVQELTKLIAKEIK